MFAGGINKRVAVARVARGRAPHFAHIIPDS